MPSDGPSRVSRCVPTGWNANVVECSAPDEGLNDCGVECNERGFGSRLKTLSATSAGGVVARKVDGKVQIALVGNSSRNTWYLPKGGLAKGETIEQAAVREVTEETGGEVADGRRYEEDPERIQGQAEIAPHRRPSHPQ